MQVPLEIAFRNMEPSEFLERRIRERVDRLHRFFDRIVSCHVAVEVPHRSQHNALTYHVRIEVSVPEKLLVVSRDPGDIVEHFDAYIAVRDAFDAMERQLEGHSQKIRREVKTHEAPTQGAVRRKFPDHGFIATTDGREVYFHRNAVANADFDDLDEGDPVELVLVHGESPAGPQASTVKRIRPMQLDRQPPT